jgi:threonine dehydrogenase-like Zn-dependent dehydrogenase
MLRPQSASMPALESKIVELLGPRHIHVRHEILDTDRLSACEIAARTICSVVSPGTEGAAYRGDAPLRPMKVYPRIVGYCNVAEILACAEDVKNFRPGDRVLTGQSHRSAFVCSQDKILARIPHSMDPTEAATTYLFQLGYNALLKGALKPGDNLAIVGLGTLGLATAAVADSLGAHVYAFSDQAIDEKILRSFRVRRVFRKSDPTSRKAVENATGSRGIDQVVSTSNLWDDWRLALSLPRKEGVICVLGFPGRSKPAPDFNPLSSEFFYDRQLRIVACGFTPERDITSNATGFNLQENCEFVLSLIAQQRLPARKLISAAASWREIGSIYERIISREPGFLSAALTWE